MTVVEACPCCLYGMVHVTLQTWPGTTGPRRSVWLDEPARCTSGCRLTPAQVERVLRTADARADAPVRQLPLFGEEEVTLWPGSTG